MRPGIAILGSCLVLTLVLTGCGGNDDDGDEFDDIRASASAAAADQTPGATSTATSSGAADDYPAAARSATDELDEALDQLNQDLEAAEASQADPKWPDVLRADIAAVKTAGEDVKELEAPEEFASVSAELEAGVDQVLRGVDLLGNAIESASQEVGAQAVLAISTGSAAVDAAVMQLPAE